MRTTAPPVHFLRMDCPAKSAQNRDRQGAAVSTYFITFVCYGAWLHGKPGAVDRHHNIPGTPLLPEDGPASRPRRTE